jgi:hypothetical protein
MGRTITLDVPEPLFLIVSSAAEERGVTPADWIVDRLGEQLDPARLLQTEIGHPRANGSEEPEHDDPFRKLFGSVDLGDPHLSDNERIDADLAKEYGAGLSFKD